MKRQDRLTIALALCAGLLFGCAGESGTAGAPAADSGAVDASADAGGDAASAADTKPADAGNVGAQPPAPKAYALGACPKLTSGLNKITAGGASRSFRLFLPAEPKGAPLVLMWHGLGDSSSNFSNAFGAQSVASGKGVVIAIPDAVAPAPNAMAVWQFPSMLAQRPPAFDLLLFDSLLSCIDDQYDIDNKRVATVGFSAGAIWSTYLVLNRGQWLASAVVFSGGVDTGGGLTFPYTQPARKVPVLGSHGGPSDQFQALLKFEPMMIALADSLAADGHTTILCNHGGGHTITGPLVLGAWDFVLSHVWGQEPSPWDAARVKSKLPSYCGLQAAP